MNPQTVPSARKRVGYESERRHLELLVRTGYERCHPDDSFDDLKRRAHFTKEDRGLLRDWLAATAAHGWRSPKTACRLYARGGKEQ